MCSRNQVNQLPQLLNLSSVPVKPRLSDYLTTSHIQENDSISGLVYSAFHVFMFFV